ncbi:unnamed protein product, partial [Didymodactylos carnosus]
PTYKEQKTKMLDRPETKYQQQPSSFQPQNNYLKTIPKPTDQDPSSSSEINLDLTSVPLVSLNNSSKSPSSLQILSQVFDNKKQQSKQITPIRSASFTLNKSDQNNTSPIMTVTTATESINNQPYYGESKSDVTDSNERSNLFNTRPLNHNNDGRSRHCGPLITTNQVYVMTTNKNTLQPSSSSTNSSTFMTTSPSHSSPYETVTSPSTSHKLLSHSQPANYFSRLPQQQRPNRPILDLTSSMKSLSFDSATNTNSDNLSSLNQRENNNRQSSSQIVLNTSAHAKPLDQTSTNLLYNEENTQTPSCFTPKRRPCHRQNAVRYKSFDNQNQNIEHSSRSPTPRQNESGSEVKRLSRSSTRISDQLPSSLSSTTTSFTTTPNRIYSSDHDYSYISRYQSIERRAKHSPSFDINNELREISWNVKEKAKLFEKLQPHSQTSKTQQRQNILTGRENYV